MEESDIVQGNASCGGNLCHFVQQGRLNGRRMRLLEELVGLQPGQHRERHGHTTNVTYLDHSNGLNRRRHLRHNACTLQRVARVWTRSDIPAGNSPGTNLD